MKKRRRADVHYDHNLNVWLRRDRRRRSDAGLTGRAFAALSVLAEPSVRSQMRVVLLVMGWTAAMCVGLWGIIR